MSNESKLSLSDKMKAAAIAGAAKASAELSESSALAAITHSKVVGYRGNHVKRLVLKNGTIVLPDADGVFVPKSQEEYDYLEHLAASSSSSLEQIIA